MATSGRARGTVTWWRPEDGGGVAEGPDLPGSCWVDVAAVEGRPEVVLRAGQVIELDWEEPGPSGYACRAVRAMAGDDLQTTPGG